MCEAAFRHKDYFQGPKDTKKYIERYRCKIVLSISPLYPILLISLISFSNPFCVLHNAAVEALHRAQNSVTSTYLCQWIYLLS